MSIDKTRFRKIQKMMALGLQELEEEAMSEGKEFLLSDEYEQIKEEAKEKILGEFGLSLDEYEELKEKHKVKKEDRFGKIESELEAIKEKLNEPMELEIDED